MQEQYEHFTWNEQKRLVKSSSEVKFPHVTTTQTKSIKNDRKPRPKADES